MALKHTKSSIKKEAIKKEAQKKPTTRRFPLGSWATIEPWSYVCWGWS
jgi:hypothetical protein